MPPSSGDITENPTIAALSGESEPEKMPAEVENSSWT
jgi:hypothetical protein